MKYTGREKSPRDPSGHLLSLIPRYIYGRYGMNEYWLLSARWIFNISCILVLLLLQRVKEIWSLELFVGSSLPT